MGTDDAGFSVIWTFDPHSQSLKVSPW